MQDIRLTIIGSQTENGEENTIELITEGLLLKQGDETVIEYDDGAMCGLEKTKTSLKIQDDCIHMRRTGEITTEFVFSEAKTYEAMYSTPMGMLQVNVFPTKVKSKLYDDGGMLDLEYEIKVGDYRAHNRLNIVYEATNS